MTAAVKKIKGAPIVPANINGKPPLVAQAKNAARAKKVAPIKKAAHVKKAKPAEITTLENNVAQVPETEHAQEVVPGADVTVNVVDQSAAEAEANNNDNVERILLPARMELANLDEAQQLLQSRYPPVHSTYILDGALLSVIDMAGIQMLISFIRSVTAKGTKVEWDNYSVQVYQLASELGVTSQLGD